MDRRWLRSGYSNIGPIQIPPLPQQIILTDRADGSQWQVTFNTTNPERISITSTWDRSRPYKLYDHDDGPTIGADGQIKVILRGGRIGLEYLVAPFWERDLDYEPPYARKTNDKRKMLVDSDDINAAHIGYNT